jgi:cysteine-rich repeat protein
VSGLAVATLVLGLAAAGGCGDDDGLNNNNNDPGDAQVPDAEISDCGNGVVEPGEECDDGNRLNGDGCSLTCEWEGSCGNGLQEPPEECDGTDGLPTCVQLGYLDGTSTCSASCLVMEDGCTEDASGLVAWYRMEGASGVVVDSTFQGNGCVAEGGLERDYPGAISQAFLFNGTDAYADCGIGNDLGGMSALTLETWVNLGQASGEAMLVSRAVDETDLGYALGIAGADNSLGINAFRAFFAVQSFDHIAESDEFVTGGDWVHVAAVYEAGLLTVFIDGVESASATQLSSGPVADQATARTFLGHLRQSGGSTLDTFYEGYLDDTKIWATVRSQSEICADAGGTPDGQGGCEIHLE